MLVSFDFTENMTDLTLKKKHNSHRICFNVNPVISVDSDIQKVRTSFLYCIPLKDANILHREMQCAWEAGPGRSERNLSGPSSVHGVTKSQTGLSNFHTHSAYQAMCIL